MVRIFFVQCHYIQHRTLKSQNARSFILDDGISNWKQYRFRQFYLDVSNISATQSSTTQRIRCYKDNTTAPSLPPYKIDIPCIHTVRYVIVETTYDAPEDDKNGVHGAILEICEIEVYGKHFLSRFCSYIKVLVPSNRKTNLKRRS